MSNDKINKISPLLQSPTKAQNPTKKKKAKTTKKKHLRLDNIDPSAVGSKIEETNCSIQDEKKPNADDELIKRAIGR